MDIKIPMRIAVQLETGYGRGSRRLWLQLPATKKQYELAVKKLDPLRSGVTINHYAARVPGTYRSLLAETPLAQVNHLTARLADLDDEQCVKLCAIIESEMRFDTVEQMIDYTYDSDKFVLVPDVMCEEDLGRRELEGPTFEYLPPLLKKWVNYHALGNDIAKTQEGEFTSFGYLYRDADKSDAVKKRRVPASLDLKGDYGEDLYGEVEFDEYDGM